MSVEPPGRAGDREPLRRTPHVPARPGVRRPGERDGRPVRGGGRGLRRVLGAPGPRAAPWVKEPTETLEWDLPFAKWFAGGQLNVAYNCVDRHVEAGLGDKVAYHWIGEPGDTRTITYADLQREVSKAANALLELGVRTGDRVAIYMPMIPELPIAMLACARIGAPHTVVFGGFSAEALSGRINDCRRQGAVITADGGWRRGKKVGLKHHADEAVPSTPTIEHTHRRRPVRRRRSTWSRGRDHWWHEIVERQAADCAPVPVESEHMLYLLYTSGTTAKPKGILHTTAGYLRRRGVHPLGGVRPQARRRLLVRGRHRLGDRAQLHRLRAARQRHDRRAVRGGARHARAGTAGGRSSRTTRSRSCTAPRPRSARS